MATQPSLLKALTDQYYRQLANGSRPSSGGSLGNPLGNLRGLYTPTLGPDAFVNRVEGAIGEHSTLGKIIDVLSRPVYSVGNQIKEGVADPIRDLVRHGDNSAAWESNVGQAIHRGDNLVNTLFNNSQGAALSGLSGRSKVLPSDAIFGKADYDLGTTQGKLKAADRFGAGLAVDIALDPLTYIPGAAIAGIARKVPGAARSIAALQKAGTLEKPVFEAADDVPRVVENVVEEVATPPATEAERLFDIKEFWKSVPKSPQQSITQVATKPRTGDGKRVYDLKRLPNLFAKPKPAPSAKAEKPKSILDWMNENTGQPIQLTDDGVRFMSEADNADGLAMTLGEFVTNAQRKGRGHRDARRDLAFVQRLYEASTNKAVTGTAKSAPDPVDLGRAAEAAASAGTRGDRLRSAQRQKNLSYLKEKLDPEDYIYLVRARSEASYKARVAEILGRAHSPIESSGIAEGVESGSQYFGQFLGGAPVGPRTPLNATDPSVIRAISRTTQRQFKPEGFKMRSKVKDTARNKRKYSRGEGISDRGFNKRAQYDMWGSLIREASNALKPTGVQGAERANIMRQRVMAQLKEADDVLRSRGIEPILGESHSGIALSFYDILNAIDATTAGRGVLFKHIFDAKQGQVAITNIADAVEELLVQMKRAGITSTDEIGDFLKTIKASKNEQGSIFDLIGRTIAGDPGGNFARTADAAARRAAKGTPQNLKGITKIETKRTWDKSAKHGNWSKEQVNLGGAEFSSIANTIRNILLNESTVKALVRANLRNSERYNAQLAYEVSRLSDDVVEEFFQTWMRPTTSTGEAIAAYARIGEAVAEAGDTINASDAAVAAARDVSRTIIDDALAEDAPILEAVGANIRNGTVESGQRMHNVVSAESTENLPVHLAVDVGENIGASIEHNIVRAIFPRLATDNTILGRAAAGFDHVAAKLIPQAGHATLRPALTQQGGAIRSLANSWRAALTDVHRAFPKPEALQPMMVLLQRGEALPIEQFTGVQRQALEQFEHLTKVLFEPSQAAGVPAASNVFFRNALQVEHINGKLTQMKLPDHMRFDPDTALIRAKQEGITLREALADQWRSWKIDDPVDFLARMQAAATSAIGDAAISREAFRIAQSKNLVSMKPRDGFVQITDTSGKSVLTRYLPENAYWHKDIVEEIKAMDEVLRQSLSFDSPFGRWVNTYYDPMLNMWKAGMTIYRLGHHVRNLIGDTGLTYLADGAISIRHSRNAMTVMAMRRNYDDFDALRALLDPAVVGADKRAVREAALLRGNLTVANVRLKGGKKVNLTAKEVYDYGQNHGMLPDFVSGEDLLRTAEGSPSMASLTGGAQLFGGKVRHAAGRMSEARDDFVRLTHFLLVLDKHGKNFRNIDELMAFAVRRVRKWHPDGTDLSPFESKIMRRVFPFYSWTKKTIPLVVESMLLQPGRIMLWPKVSYNMAVAAGVNPESISDPFPEDQLFPSFLTDEMTGPVMDTQNGYLGISPGLPNVDIMNQFIGDPKAAVMGMLSPGIKMPAELLSGSRLDTGTRIHDTSEYIGSNIPGVSHGQSLSGTDILGTLLGGRTQGLNSEQIHSVETGNREQLDINTFINFLTGLGLQNMSKPSYINIAEMELRDKARREAGY